MPQQSRQIIGPAEVKKIHRTDRRGEESSPPHSEYTLVMAKASIGAAIKTAIEGRPVKEYGHEGLMNEICSGEKVPAYMARICQDPTTRRRFALALLDDDCGVEIVTTITVPHTTRKAG